MRETLQKVNDVEMKDQKYDKCVLLDTNVVSAIANNETNRKKFLNWWLEELKGHHLSISIYTYYELYRGSTTFPNFVDTFSKLPFMILMPIDEFIKNEINHKEKKKVIRHAPKLRITVSVLGKQEMHQFQNSNDLIKRMFKEFDAIGGLERFDAIAKEIETLRNQYDFVNQNYNENIEEKLIPIVSRLIASKFKHYQINKTSIIKLATYLVYFRTFKQQKTLKRNDVLDILNFSLFDYADVLIFENSSIESAKQSKSYFSYLDKKKLVKYSDLF